MFRVREDQQDSQVRLEKLERKERRCSVFFAFHDSFILKGLHLVPVYYFDCFLSAGGTWSRSTRPTWDPWTTWTPKITQCACE